MIEVVARLPPRLPGWGSLWNRSSHAIRSALGRWTQLSLKADGPGDERKGYEECV